MGFEICVAEGFLGLWALLETPKNYLRVSYPEHQNSQKASYTWVFGPESLKV